MGYQEVLAFWFEEVSPRQWWQADQEFDALIGDRFRPCWERAQAGELFSWRRSAEGRLGEIIVLDQFSRNIFRGQPAAFAQDTLALALAQEAVAAKAHIKLPAVERCFLLMPYMHSESTLIHEEAELLFRDHTTEENLRFEMRHKAIVDRFGRYPHRNDALGRESTPEEIEFLKQPGSSF